MSRQDIHIAEQFARERERQERQRQEQREFAQRNADAFQAFATPMHNVNNMNKH